MLFRLWSEMGNIFCLIPKMGVDFCGESIVWSETGGRSKTFKKGGTTSAVNVSFLGALSRSMLPKKNLKF